MDDEEVEAVIADQSHGLSEEERQDVEEHQKLRQLAVYEVVRSEGIEELARPTPSLLFSGVTAGLSLGFSVVAEGALHAALPDAAWRPLVENFGYSVGFLIVILARQQLFTEITLTAVLPVIYKPSWRKFIALARLWSVVFLANMVGTILIALAFASGLLLPDKILRGMLDVSRHLAELSPAQAFFRAILAGWLIATLVWMLPAAETARGMVIIVMTYLIALFDLAHVVAGTVEIALLVFLDELGIGVAFIRFILPMLLGNIIGGSALFALLAHGQVVHEIDEAGR